MEEQKEQKEKVKFSVGLFEFLKEYSVIGLAIGVIVAQISKDLVDALVSGIFMPAIGLVIPGEKFQNLVFRLGSAEFNIGQVLNAFLTFLIVLMILYIVVKRILKRDDLIKK